MEVRSHKDLIVWQKAMDLAVLVYSLGQALPKQEMYGLTSQMTRAAASVPANIAEGKARATTREYAQFLTIARGSLMETETYVLLAVRVGYISDEQALPTLQLIEEVGRILNAIRAKIRSSTPNP